MSSEWGDDVILSGLTAKHADTRVRPDSPSRNYRARMFQASTNGRDFYNATHKYEGYWTVIDGTLIWLKSLNEN